MKTVTFTEFRRHASGLLSAVEKGGMVRVLRHGRPIADIRPIAGDSESTPAWKRKGLRLTITGAGLSAAILEERAHADVL